MHERELHATGKKIQKRSKSSRAPTLIHREAKLTSGIIRDVFTAKVDSLTIEGKEDILGELKRIAKGAREIFIAELHSLYEAREKLRRPDYLSRLNSGLATDLDTAEAILEEIIDKAPGLLQFGGTAAPVGS